MFGQCRQVAGVIDMGMGQKEGVKRSGVKRKMAVPLAGILAPALISAAIEKEFLSVYIEVMHRSCDSLGSSPESKLHASQHGTERAQRDYPAAPAPSRYDVDVSATLMGLTLFTVKRGRSRAGILPPEKPTRKTLRRDVRTTRTTLASFR
jgi:hypothetical protein